MKRLSTLILSLVLLGFLLLGIDYVSRFWFAAQSDLEVRTLEELYEAGITNYVGKKIAMRAPLSHDTGRKVATLSVPDIEKLPETYLYNQGSLNSVQALREDPTRAGIAAVSDDIKQYIWYIPYVSEFLPLFKIFYVYQGRLLWNFQRDYIVEGTLVYRSETLTEEMLQNQMLIRQSNNPVYWSQTFDFQVKRIY